MIPPPPASTLFPYTTLFRSGIITAATLKLFPKPHAVETAFVGLRSEEHTSELQSHSDLVCRLLLEKKNDHAAYLLLCAELALRAQLQRTARHFGEKRAVLVH